MDKVNFKIGVIGGVKATEVVIKKLSDFYFKNVKVWGFNPNDNSNVSGWVDLKKISKSFNYKYENFKVIKNKLNSIKEFEPDLLFIVGISQIVTKEILEIPKYGCIGYHPTLLPKGRGRAPLAWLILEDKTNGASTFFKVLEGVDNGPIIVQIPFEINKNDYVFDIERKMLSSESEAIDFILSNEEFPNFATKYQNDKDATYYGKRAPEDGIICWSENSESIIRLIRACSNPHPGAFSFHKKQRIYILKAESYQKPITGVIGRIVLVSEDFFVVQSGRGLVKIIDWVSDNNFWEPKVGYFLGYNPQEEIFQLKKEIDYLKKELVNLKNYLN